MHEKTDEAYMLDIQNGNLSAMAVLFERYHEPLYNYFLKLLGDAVAAEDLTQQLFVRVLHFRMTFKPGNLKAWLYRIATNLANDHHNLQSRNRPYQVALTEKHEAHADSDTGFSEQDYRALDRALLALDTEQRQLIILSKYQGLRYEEIGMMLKLPASHVRVKVHRALNQLRKTYFKTVV